MVTLTSFLTIYIFGGLTFLPLVCVALLYHAYLTCRIRDSAASNAKHKKPLPSELDKLKSLTDWDIGPIGLYQDDLHSRRHSDVAAGYFAVCREFIAGGVNGKPPERTSFTGSVAPTASSSIYQSMYRSFFDRNKTQVSVIDTGAVRSSRKASNLFYIVLRHGHLMLYDDSEQVEVRHVISLALYEVDVYAGGEPIPEGELWIKRNCIRLTRNATSDGMATDLRSLFFFSDNSSEKEDFYHALLSSKEHKPGDIGDSPLPLQFEHRDIVQLIQQLHISGESFQARWLNGLIGRIFLAVYKTSQVENYIRMKITKKIARVPKPAFLSDVSIQKIDMGHSPPYITNPKLKELAVDGELILEADVKYTGEFSLEIAAVARIELGSRFKPREVSLVLALILRKLEGHVLLRIKPPPSNRLWVSFETSPKMELAIEPIVSSRQLTYGFILRAIESRIREVIQETLVLPNWDDVPFLDTSLQDHRGGIWKGEDGVHTVSGKSEASVEDNANKTKHQSAWDKETPSLEENQVIATGVDSTQTLVKQRKSRYSGLFDDSEKVLGGTTQIEDKVQSRKPKVMRSNSFTRGAQPIVNTDLAISQSTQTGNQGLNAAASMKDISSRSHPASPIRPSTHPDEIRVMDGPKTKSVSSSSSTLSIAESHPDDRRVESRGFSGDARSQLVDNRVPGEIFATQAADMSQSIINPSSVGLTAPSEKRIALNQSINSATTMAKKWWGTRHNPVPIARAASIKLNKSHSLEGKSEIPVNTIDDSSPLLGSPLRPIGRGQPLPPIGTPLPLPKSERTTWTPTSFMNPMKRKPLPVQNQCYPSLQGVGVDQQGSDHTVNLHNPSTVFLSAGQDCAVDPQDDAKLLIIAAPTDSLPSSPVKEHQYQSVSE